MKLASSPQRHTFQADAYVRRCEEEGKEPSEDYLEIFKSYRQRDEENMANPEWQKNNMEYDLRSCDWMVAKVRANENYAQNLYAAMCNREFVKNDVWPLLKNQTWSCSWRYAGGIVAHMDGKGDYIDWYCSGIRGDSSEEELSKLTQEQRDKYGWYQTHFVGEGHVTDEIREDLKSIGWLVADDELDE